VRAAIQLLRPYTTFLAFLSILVPTLYRTKSFLFSALQAIPLLFISMCTFLINDLDDVEKDKINHPSRPLPRGDISPVLVVIIYYTCLAAALLTIRLGVQNQRAEFLYYALLTLAISYGYIVEYLPIFKPVYVAGTSALPILILIALYPPETMLYLMAGAVFAFILGRELCLDLMDRPGDAVSALHRVHPSRLATIALSLEVAGLLLVSPLIATVTDLLIGTIMTALIALAWLCWFKHHRFRAATNLMKAAMYVGLYFLIS